MSLVNVRNCIRFYQTAEELSAGTLLNYCAEIIASHWVSERWRVRGQLRPWKPGDLRLGLGSMESYFSGTSSPLITKLKAE